MSVIKKKKHVSKKGKKAWRKHCDIQDVEEFLEDQRLEERLGKFDVKPDSELFIIDTGGDKETTEDNESEKPITAKQRKRAKLTTIPKCYEVLLPSSKVPDPNAKRNHVNPAGVKPTALSKLTEKRKSLKGALGKKLELARKNRKLALEKKRKAKVVKHTFKADLWGQDVPEAKGVPEELCDEFISQEVQLHNVLPERRLRARPPLPKTVTTRAAVEAPHPGVSYNPTYQEHQELLQQVASHEQKMIKRETHLLRVTNGMFSKVTREQNQNRWLEEMSAGLPKPDEPKSQQSGSESDNEYRAINPPVKNKKKDHKARRKQKERLLEIERLKREKIDKKKISDIYRLRHLQTKISKTEEVQAKERDQRQAKRAQKEATGLPSLSAHKTPKKEPDFVDPTELTGDLRNIQSKTNLLRERYESLQRRGAIAASKLMMKKKKKQKSYFKAGHKVTDQEVERYIAKFENSKLKTRA